VAYVASVPESLRVAGSIRLNPACERVSQRAGEETMPHIVPTMSGQDQNPLGLDSEPLDHIGGNVCVDQGLA
jgi:hypothetical protein